MRDPRFVWRRIFEDFEVHDRVKIINQVWIYSNQIGYVVEKQFVEGRWYYLLCLPEETFKILGHSKHSEANTAGWFKNVDLCLVEEDEKSGPLFKGLRGTMSHRLRDRIKWINKMKP